MLAPCCEQEPVQSLRPVIRRYVRLFGMCLVEPYSWVLAGPDSFGIGAAPAHGENLIAVWHDQRSSLSFLIFDLI